MGNGVPYDGPERRVKRLTIPHCAICGSWETTVIGRTYYWVYVQCSQCAYLWSVRKPGHEPTPS